MPSPSLHVRNATSDDSRDIFEWRNDPTTRSVSLSTEEVNWTDHDRWFAASMANPRRKIYICEADLGDETVEPVCMVRFDLDDSGEQAEVSINVNPLARGRGFGTEALRSGLRRFSDDWPSVARVTARIRDSNSASVALFTKAGFELAESANGVGHYERAN
ncbi:MAG: GNAT family N-acetyltransferase [Microbacteriaceae bacterium]